MSVFSDVSGATTSALIRRSSQKEAKFNISKSGNDCCVCSSTRSGDHGLRQIIRTCIIRHPQLKSIHTLRVNLALKLHDPMYSISASYHRSTSMLRKMTLSLSVCSMRRDANQWPLRKMRLAVTHSTSRTIR